MTTWKTTYISAVVHQAGDNPIINDHSTTVTICDEAGGAFISLTDCEGVTIKLDPEELEIVANVARGMLECFEDKPRTPISVINEAFNKSEDIMNSLKREMLEANVTPRMADDGRWHKAARDLLAVIYCDGGNHAGKVGFVQACEEAESIVLKLRSGDGQSKSNEWTAAKPTKGGIYWVQFDYSMAPQSVEVYKLDEDDVWRARVVGKADILGNHIASFQVESLANALWCGPLSAPTLTENEA